MQMRDDNSLTLLGKRFSQRFWRSAGGAALLGAAVTALFLERAARAEAALSTQMWGLGFFIVFLGAAFYCVLLDIRFIRMQYALAKRDAFLSTLGSEEFREALRQQCRKETGPDMERAPETEFREDPGKP